jgi:hypothetical protein
MRLGDLDELVRNIDELSKDAGFYKPIYEWFSKRIKDAPTIDAVAVVRCRDCKHGEVDDPEDFPDQYYCHAGCGWNKEDFFCFYGERRGDGFKCPCKHGISRHSNELGEDEVYCELTARWMNVSLGDCLGNCESEEQKGG